MGPLYVGTARRGDDAGLHGLVWHQAGAHLRALRAPCPGPAALGASLLHLQICVDSFTPVGLPVPLRERLHLATLLPPLHHEPLPANPNSLYAPPCLLSSLQYPPPDASRLGTADLCDVHHPEPVDVVSQPKIQIMQVGCCAATWVLPPWRCSPTALGGRSYCPPQPAGKIVGAAYDGGR